MNDKKACSSSNNNDNSDILPENNNVINKITLKRELPVYKLTYFNSRGYAEVSRLILHYKKVPFDDIRVNADEWSYYKDSIKQYGQLPTLEFQGEKLSEAMAIARFLARRHGLAGKNELEEAKVDSLLDTRMHFGQSIQTYIALSVHQHPSLDLTTYIQQNFQESFMTGVEKFAPKLQEYLINSQNGWFMNGGITYADFAIAELTDTVDNFYPIYKQRFPLLADHSKRVHSLPELNDYLKTRPFSKY